MAQCSARSKRTHNQCGAPAMTGRSVCYHHGGKQVRGVARHNTTHGRYSKDLPTRMGPRYEEAKTDPELLALKDEIALLDSRLSDVLSRVDSGESGALWSKLSTSWSRFVRARESAKPLAEKTEEMRQALSEHEALLAQGRADYAAWSEIGSLLDRRQRFVESERKRYVEMQQMVSLEQAMLFLGAVTDAIRRHVTDRPTLAALGRELELIADAQPRAVAPGRGRRATG